jgi:Alternative complex III, ActD subunit
MRNPFAKGPAPSRGVLALYDDPDKLLRAAALGREHGFADMDAYTPYAVHGLSEALGIKKSWVPYVTLVMGLSGAALGLTFEIWASAIDWPINVGGKPLVSLPAFIPITFESGVLIGGTMTLAALLIACGLPNLGKPILDRDLTNDRFALWVPEIGPDWNERRIIQVLRGTHAADIRVVRV